MNLRPGLIYPLHPVETIHPHELEALGALNVNFVRVESIDETRVPRAGEWYIRNGYGCRAYTDSFTYPCPIARLVRIALVKQPDGSFVENGVIQRMAPVPRPIPKTMAETILEDYADEYDCDWSTERRLQIACAFIDEYVTTDKFEDFVMYETIQDGRNNDTW